MKSAKVPHSPYYEHLNGNQSKNYSPTMANKSSVPSRRNIEQEPRMQNDQHEIRTKPEIKPKPSRYLNTNEIFDEELGNLSLNGVTPATTTKPTNNPDSSQLSKLPKPSKIPMSQSQRKLLY